MKRHFVRLIRPWIAELIIRGLIPEKIWRYRVLDCLSALENGDDINPKSIEPVKRIW